MKRNTAIALAYWLVLTAVVMAMGSVEETNPSVFMGLGLAYVLLSWSPFLIVKFIERRPVTSLGLRMDSPLRIILWGVGTFILTSMLLIVETWYRVSFHQEQLTASTLTFSGLLRELAMQLLWIGLPEEIWARGYLFTRLRESWGIWTALLLSSLLFGIGHLGLGDFPRAIQAGLSGLVYGAAFIASGSVYAPALAHTLDNMFGLAIARAILSR